MDQVFWLIQIYILKKRFKYHSLYNLRIINISNFSTYLSKQNLLL